MYSHCSKSSDSCIELVPFFSVLVIKSEHIDEVEHNVYRQISLNGAGNKSKLALCSTSCF